jgi:hypothetical protein
MKKLLFVVWMGLLLSGLLFSQQLPPAVFYSDLTSGPNTGGQNNAGVFVTLHGKGFGSIQGESFVTIGGGNAASYQSWTDSTITFQLGSAATSGSILVSANGLASNAVPFTVRAGSIRFVAANGRNSNPGTYAEPWQTIAYAVNSIRPGDVVYIESLPAANAFQDGFQHDDTLAPAVSAYLATPRVNTGSALLISHSGTAAQPMALLAYPNSSVVIGSSLANGIYLSGSNWILSGLTLRGGNTALLMSNVNGVRVAGNDVSCPNASSATGCISAIAGSAIAVLGNHIHDTGSPVSANPEYYQAMDLFETTGFEVGWNTIENTRGCNAISARSTSAPQHSISVHDNFISNTRCSAIELGSVDPSLGEVALYNNILLNSGTGPAFGGLSADYGYSAIQVGGASSIPVQAYNNTIYNAGSLGGPDAGAVRSTVAINLTNNIFYLLSGQQYVAADTSLALVTGSNNLFFGSGAPLGTFAESIAADPLFTSLSLPDFHLLPESPAIARGSAMQSATDYDGVPRSQSDIGAYQHITAALAPVTRTSLQSDENTTGSQDLRNDQASAEILSDRARVPVAGANLSATTLTFAAQSLGTSSTAQSITLKNTGRATLSISRIAASGDFAQTNLCGSSLAVGTSCTVSVTFTPTASGTRSGAITFTDNASSPQLVSLSGTGSAATLQAASSSLSFGSITAGTSSSQTLVITNSGTASATIQSIATGNTAFTVTGATLPATVASGASLTLTITFAPTTAGSYTGTLAIQSNATNSTLSVALSGTATAATPTLTLSPTSLTFAAQSLGTTSAAQTITLTNKGTAALAISAIAASGDFAQTNLCGSSLAVSASCTISVTFTPTATGTRSGAITFADNAASSPQSVSLTGTATAATLQAASSSLSFGSVTAGTSSSQTLVITNSGTAPATIQAISTGNTAFTVTGATLPATVASGASLTLTITFAPTAAGSYTGTLAIQSNATNSTLSVALSGTAVTATPTLTLSPTSLTFAAQSLGTTSAAQSITLTNNGTAALSISGIAASGDFAQTNLCGSSLAVSASCTISVTFTPTATGTRSGAITFTDNAASSPQSVSLTGTATAATLQSASSSLSFGSITAGTSSSQTLVITNTGTASATIQAISTGNTAFTVTGATLPATVASGASLTLTITFAPTTAGSYTGTLAIQSNATNSTLSVALSGTATAATPTLTLSPTSLTFAAQSLGTTSAAQTITLTNKGTAALAISAIAASGDFAQTNLCGSSLAVSASCTISVTFTPTATGTRSGAITLTDNAASSPQLVSLSGTGSAATLQAASSSLSFGSVTAGTSSSQTLVITNSGTAPATIQAISTGNTAFTVTGATLPATVASGASLTLTITFAPTTAGSYTGTLAIQSNATNSTLSVALSGTATAAAPVSHSVTVNWTDAATAISGYNVYRSTQSGTGYVKLTASLVTCDTYVDTSVSAGQTYYYVATAVSTSGVESSYSTQVSATVPTP